MIKKLIDYINFQSDVNSKSKKFWFNLFKWNISISLIDIKLNNDINHCYELIDNNLLDEATSFFNTNLKPFESSCNTISCINLLIKKKVIKNNLEKIN